MMFYHFVLHCTFKSEAPLTGAAAIHHQHSVAQGRQSAQPQVLHPFVGVVHQLNLQGNKRSSGLTHFNHWQHPRRSSSRWNLKDVQFLISPGEMNVG